MYVHIQFIFIYKEKMITCNFLDNTYWFKGQVFFWPNRWAHELPPLSCVWPTKRQFFCWHVFLISPGPGKTYGGIRYEICRGYHYFCKPPYLNCHHPENLLWQPKMPADNEEENFWPPSQGSRIVWDPTPDSQHKTSIRKTVQRCSLERCKCNGECLYISN